MQIFEGKHLTVQERDGWEFVERKRAREAVAIIATDGGRLVLTEQFRRAVNTRVLDLPAGLIEQYGAEETARRELEEETGFTCTSLTLLATAPTSPGITSAIVHCYQAEGLRRTGAGGGVEGEEITVHLVPLQQAEAWLRKRSEMVDVKVWAALYFASQST